jgi:AcrR family transcriptional regulator
MSHFHSHPRRQRRMVECSTSVDKLGAMAERAKRSSRAGRARRKAILAAAEEIFAAQGYRGASLQTIAERVGISQPGLLHHFPTKEHLFVEILDVRQAEDEQMLAQFLAEYRGDVFEAILAVCRDSVSKPELTRLFTMLAAESLVEGHPGHEWFIKRFRRARDLVARHLAARQDDGWMSADVDVDELAAQILGMYDGLALQWELDPARVHLVDAMTTYFDGLRVQIGAPGRPKRRARPADVVVPQ